MQQLPVGWTHSSVWAQGHFQDFVDSLPSTMSSSPNVHEPAVIRLTWPLSLQQSPECSLSGINCHEDRKRIAAVETLTCDISEHNALLVTGPAGLGCPPRNFHSWEERFPKNLIFLVLATACFSLRVLLTRTLGSFSKNSGSGQ